MRARNATATVLSAVSINSRSGSTARLDRRELIRIERAEPIGEPGRPAFSHLAEQPLALGRELEADAPPVDGRPHADDQACPLEPIDVTGKRGRGDRLLGCEGTERQAGAAFHEPEQRHLAGRDAELLRLLAQLAADSQHDGAKVVRQRQRRIRSRH